MTEWAPRGQTVNQHYYLRVLTTLGEEIGLNCGKTTVGYYIKTTRRLVMPYLLSSFWPKIERQCYDSPLIRRISLRVPFDYFQN